MPVKHHHRGTGLTKESRVHIKFSKPPTQEETDAHNRMFRQIGAVATFEGKVEFFETWAIDTLESAGLPTDGRATVKEVQSFPWYANKILCDLNLIRKIKARVTAGKGAKPTRWRCSHYSLGFCSTRSALSWIGSLTRFSALGGAKC